jgi:hypothetical protein
MDPRIRIHPKMSWIRNAGTYSVIQNCQMQCCGYGFIMSAFKWIRIQGFDDQKFKKKIYCRKKLPSFHQKLLIYLSLGLHKRRPSYRKSHKPSKENIQLFKKFHLLGTVILNIFAGNFCPPGSDSGLESGSRDLHWIWIQNTGQKMCRTGHNVWITWSFSL